MGKRPSRTVLILGNYVNTWPWSYHCWGFVLSLGCTAFAATSSWFSKLFSLFYMISCLSRSTCFNSGLAKEIINQSHLLHGELIKKTSNAAVHERYDLSSLRLKLRFYILTDSFIKCSLSLKRECCKHSRYLKHYQIYNPLGFESETSGSENHNN